MSSYHVENVGQQKFGFAMASIRPSGLTFNSFLLFALGLSLAMSGFKGLRVEIMGLHAHPYLLVVGIIFPLLAAFRLKDVPTRILISLSAFAVLYFLSTFTGGVALGEGVKIFAALTTIICAALLVRSWTDFSMAVLGLSLAIGFLAVNGLDAESIEGGSVEAIEMANRNAFSLYALPIILLGGIVALRRDADYLIVRFVIVACMFAALVVIAISLNRSGWLGALVVGLMLFKDRRVKGLFLALLLAAGTLFIVSRYYDLRLLEERLEASTPEARSASDELRLRLIFGAIEIGLENPVFGASPQGLPEKLAQKIGYPSGYVSPHNVFTHLIGGSGFFCFFALLYAGWVLWSWRSRMVLPPQMEAQFKQVHTMLRMMLILWGVRGFFTHEILYSPGFCIGLGLCIGLCIAFTPKVIRMGSAQQYSIDRF